MRTFLKMLNDPRIQSWADAVLGALEADHPYKKFVIAPLVSTDVDAHSDRFKPAQVREAAETLRGQYINYKHDLSIQPIGKALETATFEMPDGHLWAIAIVGFFDVETGSSYAKFSAAGVELDQLEALPEPALNALMEDQPSEPAVSVIYSVREISASRMSEPAVAAPPFVQLRGNAFRKAVDADAIIQIFLPIALGIPILTKIMEKPAEAFWAWFQDSLLPKIVGTRVFLVFSPGPYRIELHMTASDGIQAKAAASLVKAASLALSLAERIHANAGLHRLVYKYTPSRERWEPAFAVTERLGVITDAPVLITAEQLESMKGFSVGGNYTTDEK